MATTTSNQADALGKIDLSDVPAIIKWNDTQPRVVGSSLSSTPVSLDIDFDPSTHTASFRLRVALLQHRSDKTVPLFLLIGSTQIQSLSIRVPDQTPYIATEGESNTACLRFQLSGPSTLVAPPETPRLKDKLQLTTMRSMRWAARQTVLVVHIQHDILSAHQLKVLCETSYDQYTSSLRHTDISKLYGGRGGKIFDVGAADIQPENAPPSYDEVPSPPPMAPITYGSDTATSSKKRRWVDSPAEDFDVSVIEKLCRKIMDEQYEKTRAELSNMESRLMQRLDQGLNNRVHDLNETWELKFQKLEGQVQELRTEFEAKVQVLEDGTRELDDSCQAEIQRLDESMREISDDIDKRVDLEVEDRVLGIKLDLEDFLKDELSTTADTLKQRIAEASVYIEFKE